MIKPVLLPYQQQWVTDRSPVKVWEKSRRIGASWCEAADSSLTAAAKKSAGGMDVWYIGYNKDMAEEFIRDVCFWTEFYGEVVRWTGEVIIDDPRKDILAFRVNFASGFRVTALSSRPSNLRGKQGKVVIDEAAFHDDLEGLLKAAIALLMWGGRVCVLSTHFGEDNPFNQLVQDIRAGKKEYSLHRTTLDDALRQHLYQKICEQSGLTWTEEAESVWRADLINFYGEDADEELFCIPSQGGGVYLLRNVLEACMDPEVPVIRWQPPARNFVDWRDDQRFREVRVWCEGELASVLENMGRDPVWIGEDFGRNVDLTAIWPLQQMPRLMYKTPFLLELSDCPFSQQEQIFCFVCDRLHKFAGGALDKGGNGAFLAERARQHYGQHRIEEVHFADSWNLENWPPARAALEDRTVTIPRDNQVLEDFRAVKKVKGVPKVPRDARTENRTGNKRHGDTAIAYVLSMFAARSFAAGGPAEYEPVSANRMAAVKGAF